MISFCLRICPEIKSAFERGIIVLMRFPSILPGFLYPVLVSMEVPQVITLLIKKKNFENMPLSEIVKGILYRIDSETENFSLFRVVLKIG